MVNSRKPLKNKDSALYIQAQTSELNSSGFIPGLQRFKPACEMP